ncbi:MAG TPA: FAD-dependent monooxygenase [Candidatus Paceibacterota bacterium]|nr:FAD-dependent monooxygenase [Candidatus Paceibacterota bacterium]
MAKPVTIIGGGLAGLTLGIGLRQLGVPVVIHEAGTYPRHRVCGEFISGRGQATLARLGLGELIGQAGAVSAQTVAFFTATKSTAPRPLPSAAICLSRFTLDVVLAEKFRELGGELRESLRFVGDSGEGVVRGTGRHAQTEKNGARWFGLKVHGRNIALDADLEMHVSARGYVGLCKINGGEVNVCGLFRKYADENGESKNRRELLRGQPGSPLHQRLATAEFDESSFCAVAGLSLRPQQAAARAEICVGDAITMIPPVTGNGMSMAFESAELAMAPLVAWSRDESSWNEARQQVARDCDAAFARRLAWAKWLQRIVLTPVLQNPLVALAARSDWFWRMAFEHTR